MISLTCYNHPIYPHQQDGFVLVATLWILAGLTILASYIGSLTDISIQRALQQQSEIESELHRLNTENTLIYLIATNRMNHLGILLETEQRFADDSDDTNALPMEPVLELTGRIYQGLSDVRFSLQDETALVTINSPRFPMLHAALKSVGIDRNKIITFKARLEDYIDQDQKLSLNGAEFYDYRVKDLAPPPNYLMATPIELKELLGFEDLMTSQQWHRLKPFMSMRQAVGYNFNTMRPALIAALLGLDEKAILPLVEARQKTPIRFVKQIESLLGRFVDVDEEELRVLPSRFIRISTWYQNSGQRYLSGVEFTPFVDQSPWRKDYYYTEQNNEVGSGKPKKAATPLL